MCRSVRLHVIDQKGERFGIKLSTIRRESGRFFWRSAFGKFRPGADSAHIGRVKFIRNLEV